MSEREHTCVYTVYTCIYTHNASAIDVCLYRYFGSHWNLDQFSCYSLQYLHCQFELYKGSIQISVTYTLICVVTVWSGHLFLFPSLALTDDRLSLSLSRSRENPDRSGAASQKRWPPSVPQLCTMGSSTLGKAASLDALLNECIQAFGENTASPQRWEKKGWFSAALVLFS